MLLHTLSNRVFICKHPVAAAGLKIAWSSKCKWREVCGTDFGAKTRGEVLYRLSPSGVRFAAQRTKLQSL